jgi:hypothetical protein
MKYYSIIVKLKTNEEIYKSQKNNKLFEDFQKKQDIINNLRQKYLYKEGEKYTFFPVINNYFMKFKYRNINNISNNGYNSNNKFSITEYDNKRFEKNKKIKRIRISKNKSKKNNLIINKQNYFLNTFLLNKKSTPNILIKNKTEENIFKIKEKNMTLKSLIQEEKIKDKKINKNIINNMSQKNVNKIINTIFSDTNKNNYKNKKNLKRIKTEKSILTNDESSNNITDKTYFKLQSDNSSTFDNINFSIKKINDKNNFLINNKSSINIKKNDNTKNKIVCIDINKPKIIKNKKIVIYKKVFNNKNYNKTEYNKNSPKEKNKKISIIPYSKIKINNKQIFIKKRNFDEMKEIQKNNRYKINFNKTQINNEDTTQTSDHNEFKEKNKEIYKNISFEIKEKNKLNEKENENDNVSIQSLSDSKVLEIANTYIKEQVDKNKISEILSCKKLQSQNYFYNKI